MQAISLVRPIRFARASIRARRPELPIDGQMLLAHGASITHPATTLSVIGRTVNTVNRGQWTQANPDIPRGALVEMMGIELSIDNDQVVGRMPVEGNTQPYGLLHGGATAVLIETVGSVAAAIQGRGKLPVGIELSVSHHRSAVSGFVTATTEPVHLGGTLASFLIPVFDDQERRIATGRLTCLLRDPGAIPSQPDA